MLSLVVAPYNAFKLARKLLQVLPLFRSSVLLLQVTSWFLFRLLLRFYRFFRWVFSFSLFSPTVPINQVKHFEAVT